MTAVSTLVAPDRAARTALLLDGPILATLLRLAWPNVLVMVAQASTGLIETFWVSRLGPDALAGRACRAMRDEGWGETEGVSPPPRFLCF